MTFIAPNKVFNHLDRLSGWQNGDRPAPVTVEWDLSNACSLACQSCHFAHTHERGPWLNRLRALPVGYESTGEFADALLVRRALREMADAGVQGIVWSGGGEPTLHPAWVEIVAFAHGLGLEQGMYTLGGHLPARDAVVLGSAATWIVISLDACDAVIYAKEKGVSESRFYDACDGIRRLAAVKQATIGVSYLLHANNWRRCEDMLKLARGLGANYVTFRPTIETRPDAPGVPVGDRKWIELALPRDRGYLTILERMEREPDVEIDLDRFRAYRDWQSHGYATCYGPRLHATVTPDGRVWICPQRRGVAGSCLGDLRVEPFGDILARHPGGYKVDEGCRAMCRLHQVNEVLCEVFKERPHAAFV